MEGTTEGHSQLNLQLFMIGVKVGSNVFKETIFGHQLPFQLFDTFSVILSFLSVNHTILTTKTEIIEKQESKFGKSVLLILLQMPAALANQLCPPALFVLIGYITGQLYTWFLLFLAYIASAFFSSTLFRFG